MFRLALIVALLIPTLAAAASHPLDALEASEIVRAAALLRDAGHADADTYFASISLREPPKARVLAWKVGDPIPRAADVIMRVRRRTYGAVVDLSRGQVESFSELPGVQPSIGGPEFIRASESATGDSRTRDGLEKRGITDTDQIFCAPRSIGNFGKREEQTRRLVKVDCFDMRGARTNAFATPIEGLFATVDLDTSEVVEVTDLGVLPIPPGTGELDVESVGAQRDAKPILQSAPQGANVRVDGSVVHWQKWSFHLRWDARAGVILSQLSFNEGDGPRSVLYQGSMGEIFVPYQDPTKGWYFRNYMDAGDYGLGASGSELVSGSDCPADATYVSPVMANSGGGADRLPNRICIFERSPGQPLWRHAGIVSQEIETRPALELIVRYIATVGNYDYVFDWLLDQTGSITFRGGATGIDSVKGVTAKNLSDPTAADDTAWGPLIAPGRAGINHDHFFSIRLDVDVDGIQNTFVRDTLVVEPQPEEGPRRSLWRVRPVAATTDSEARYRLSFERPALWKVVNPHRQNRLGYPVSYALRTAGNALPLVDEADPPLGRALFATHHLWVTPYDPDEHYPAGPFPNQAPGGQGLPEWTQHARNVQDTDIVLWYTLGFHHIPSAEDWPVYNLGWHSVTLRPYNFFDQNPGLDVPPAESRD